MSGKKIDRATVLRDFQAIEDDDYDGFVLLVQAARNRNVTFDPDLPVWRVARHCCIEPKGVPAVPQSSKTGSTSPVDNYDKPGV